MSESLGQSVLRRMAAAHRPPENFLTTPQGALLDAFVRAADKSFSLFSKSVEGSCRQASLSELLDILPDKGMLAVLEGPKESQGVMIVDPNLLSGVVEFQTIGTVNSVIPSVRRATRTDSALMSGFINTLLKLFDENLEETEHYTWSGGYSYSSTLPDARPFALLLEDETYQIVEINVHIGEVAREGKITLALLAKGRGPAKVAKTNSTRVSDEMVVTKAQEPEKWTEDFGKAVQDSSVSLTGVLHRMSLPISRVNALRVGEILTIPLSSIGSVRVEGQNGSLVAEGRLGQSMNQRAIRLDHIGPSKVDPNLASIRHFVDSGAGKSSLPANDFDHEGLLSLQTESPDIEMPGNFGASAMSMPDADGFDDLGVLSDLPSLESLPGGSDDAVDMGDFPDLPDLDLGDFSTPTDFPDIADLPKIE